jgi:membrane associated rhomboid family serine protease
MVLNVAAFIAAITDSIDVLNWVLWYGDGLHPLQWILSNFMHADIMHLVGNMVFLWVFGLIVEGKLGWWRFLLCYLAIGMIECALEQAIMLGAAEAGPGSLGASAIIFGLVGMAAIWAPLNEVTFFYYMFFRPGTFDVSLGWVAALYAGWEVVMLCIYGTSAGGSWMHLGGFLIGTPIAIVLLKLNIVDCEGMDAFHVWAGDYGTFRKEPDRTAEYAKIDAERKTKDEQLLVSAKQQFKQYLAQSNPEAAIRLYEKLKGVRGGFAPNRDEWMAIIQWLHSQSRWADSAPYMAACIAANPAQENGLRIALAQICVQHLQRPGKALDLLKELDRTKLNEKQISLAQRIKALAMQQQQEGVVELDVDSW